MSVEAMTACLHHADVSGTDKVVLLGIANHDGDGGSWPSIATLASYANVSDRSVTSAIQRLVDKGLILVHRNDGGTHRTDPRYRPNRYTIMVRCPAECDGTTQHRLRSGVKSASSLDDPGVKLNAPRGEVERDPGVKPASPEPSFQPSSEPSTPSLLDGDVLEVVDRSFDEFWSLYPRKVGKGKALTAWQSAVRSFPPARRPALRVQIVEALAARVDWWKRSRTETQFIPHPATWLNQKRWLDELEPVKAAAASNAQAQRDRELAQRTEVEQAIADGDFDLAWRMIVDRAEASGDLRFVAIAAAIEPGRPADRVALLSGYSLDECAPVLAAHAAVFTAAERRSSAALPHSLSEG